jgi:hypothetical protein
LPEEIEHEMRKMDTLIDRAEYVLQGEVKTLSDLIGRSFTRVKATDDEILFYLADDVYVLMNHHQDCCESVYVEDICGDLEDLVGAQIVHFEERTQIGGDDDSSWGSQTWTFYDIQTTRGCVNIRWLGESNGYYSESVDISLVDARQGTEKALN